MKLIFDIPTDIVVQLLSKWLKRSSICTLGVALCSKENRLRLEPVYEALIWDCGAESVGNNDQAENQLNWFAIRKIRFSFFCIDYPLPTNALPAMITVLKQSNTLLQTLQLTGIDNFLSSIDVPVLEYCTGIIDLTVSNMALCAPFFAMVSKLRSLENLTLVDCEKLNIKHTVGASCISVKNLSLVGKYSIKIQQRLLNMCPNLVNYNLGVEVAELRDMPASLESLCVDQCTSVRIVNLNTNLRKLKICSLEGNDSDVVGMLTSCLHLQELDLSYNGFLTDVTLTRIADSYGGTLADLNIGGWEGVSCAAIKYLCEKCTGLNSFRIGGISDDFDPHCIIVALDHCQSLRTLDISCSTITDEVLVRIAAAPLEDLNILAIRGFTDEGIMALVKGCVALNKIVIGSKLLKYRNMWKELRPDLNIS